MTHTETFTLSQETATWLSDTLHRAKYRLKWIDDGLLRRSFIYTGKAATFTFLKISDPGDTWDNSGWTVTASYDTH